MHMFIKSIVTLMAVFCLVGCADLPAVRSFATNTVALANSIDQIAQDTSASCLRRLALDAPIKGLNEKERKDYIEVCTKLKEATDLFVELNKVTRNYGNVLGQLADDKLVSYTTEIGNVKSSIEKIKADNNQYFDGSQVNAVGSLADLLLHALTDAYRQKEIKQMLEHHEDLVKHSLVLQTFLNRAYLPTLKNEEDNIDSIEETIKTKYLSTEPLRANELLESLKQQRTNIVDRRKTANDCLNAISKMIDAHGKLRQNANNLDNKLLVQLLDDYSSRISDVKSQIQKSF